MTSKMAESTKVFASASRPGNVNSRKKTWISSLEVHKKEAVGGI